jgi:glycosyltransferase involved in cell wall biosynthesis
MGLENLIAAIEIVRRDVPDIMVMIAGRGVLQPQLAAQIDALGLGGNVTLIGFVSDDDLPYVYRAADLSVVPTVALEGFGLIAAESLAAGTPCLVSPIGGLPEVVAALSNNLVLKSPAIADIAHGICGALQGSLSLPDDASCRAYAAQHFDWRIIAARVAEVYRQAAA